MMDGRRFLRLLMRTAKHAVMKVVATNVAQHDRSHAAIADVHSDLEGVNSPVAVSWAQVHEFSAGQESRKARRLRLMSRCRGQERTGMAIQVRGDRQARVERSEGAAVG